MKKKPLDSVFDLEWNPRIIIEASAGTGKTYTIVGLLIRLLIEKKLQLDQILVMTFTKKATSELRERIFERLRDCLHVLENGYAGDDSFLKEFDSIITEREEAAARIRHAIRNFDDAQVTTIHGFCQKLMNEESLLAGTPFEVDVIQQDELLKQATEDFWRNFIDRHGKSEAGRYYISKLLNIAKTPDELRKELDELFSKSYALVEGERFPNPVKFLEEVLELRKELVQLWKKESTGILDILNRCDISRFQQHLNSRLRKLEDFLSDEMFALDAPDSLQYFTSEYLYDEENLPKSRKAEPTEKHPFFELLTRFEDKISDIKRVETELIFEIYETIIDRRKKLSEHSESATYDDLLQKVDQALTDPERGSQLAESLQKKYPFALVDEFQDTDPVQYSIFNSIYPESSTQTGLLMIGDPKQAIYAFRGADVYTYFRAASESTGTFYTLKNNYRSSPQLVEAVNRLFEQTEAPFIEEEIGFFRSDSGRPGLRNAFQTNEKSPPPFRLTTRKGIETNKSSSKEFAFSHTVQQIASLLEQLERGEVTLEGRKLQAADIAVLVQSHKDARELKARLKRAGVDSVAISRDKVFESPEARRLQLVMDAVLDPLNRTKVNSALLSGFFGISLNQLMVLQQDEEAYQALIEELQELQETWNSDGFYPMFRSLLFSGDRLQHFSKLNDSERVLTNLYHLADICGKAEQEGRLDPHALFSWYQKEMAEPDKDEEKTLLLESDQNLVKISTIHNSKGLQYPVVFCPVLWDGKGIKNRLLEPYHRPGEDELIINIDRHRSEAREVATRKRTLESAAEEVRKAYVAVTRARFFCSVIWDTHNTSHFSGLGALLVGRKYVTETIENNYKTIKEKGLIDDDHFLDLFRELDQSHSDLFEIRIADDQDEILLGDSGRKSENESGLMVRPYNGRKELPAQRHLDSFSSLTGQKTEPGAPDYDQIMEAYAEALSPVQPEEKGLNMYQFPRGATAGTVIHKIFEHDDFDFAHPAGEQSRSIVRDVLEQYRFDEKWMPVLLEMLEQVSGAELSGFNLHEVSRDNQLREMEFYFSSKPSTSERLLHIIRNGKHSAGEFGQGLKHFMTGFIDLIVRVNGKYFILDYKSNYLGDSPEDYRPEVLQQEIEAAGYDLQYHLYIVALIKYLRKRVPGFDYDRHFGGAAYLFVRGMKKNSGNGVWVHKPERNVIEQLEMELSRTT